MCGDKKWKIIKTDRKHKKLTFFLENWKKGRDYIKN